MAQDWQTKRELSSLCNKTEKQVFSGRERAEAPNSTPQRHQNAWQTLPE
jgi:hypothetical protein